MTDVPHNASNAAPAVGYRLSTGDEREQLRAENDRLRRELERVKAELSEARAEERRKVAAKLRAYADNYPPDVFPPDSDNRDAIAGTAMRHAYLTAARIAEEADPGR